MRVFKFGGASINGADAIINVVEIINRFKADKLVVVISAMGKTTNALEEVVKYTFEKQADKAKAKIDEIEQNHKQVAKNLFGSDYTNVETLLDTLFEQLSDVQRLNTLDDVEPDYSQLYDQIVPFGELVSTTIVHQYLKYKGFNTCWLDVRTVIKTNDTYREGKVMWDITKKLVEEKVLPLVKNNIVVTQGFLGGTITGQTTTLGREGSDFSGAIMAHCINAVDLTIWKDVSGVLNADPKLFEDTQLLERISYAEALELAHAGATVIHPKTMKPLQNKNIRLYVKSFIKPDEQGTVIGRASENDTVIPCYVFKYNQVLIQISSKQFSFISEKDISYLFDVFAQNRVKVNLMQNAAKYFSVCVNNNERKLPGLLELLEGEFALKHEENLELITIRHYENGVSEKVLNGKNILISEEIQNTARYVARP